MNIALLWDKMQSAWIEPKHCQKQYTPLEFTITVTLHGTVVASKVIQVLYDWDPTRPTRKAMQMNITNSTAGLRWIAEHACNKKGVNPIKSSGLTRHGTRADNKFLDEY